jgi:hypothetical protein
MKNIFLGIQSFFFREQTALGFGLMRISWAVVAGTFFLMQWQDVSLFYSDVGVLPPELMPYVTRTVRNYSILSLVVNADAVFSLYILMLVCMGSMALGIFPRFMTIASVLLFFSFQERNPMVLGGGDTLLRDIGFLLMIAPNIGAFSLKNLARKKELKKKNVILPESTMPIWPYRLLLWEMIIVYVTTAWYKFLGVMWWHGTAVEVSLHHPIFLRTPMWLSDAMVPLFPFINWTTLLWEILWLLLLVPRRLVDLLPPKIPRYPLRRMLIVGGIIFHGGILIMMDAGSFSLAIFTAYFGLLQEEDFAVIRRLAGKR